MYADLPLFHINIKLWRFLGYIDFKSRRRALIVVTVPALTFVSQLLSLYMVWGDFVTEVLSMFMVSVMLNALVRLHTIMGNERKFVQFLKSIAQWYSDAELANDKVVLQVLNDAARRAQTISKITAYLSFVGVISAAAFPFVIKQPKLIVDIYIPGIDMYESPWFEITYATQIFIVAPFAVATYMVYTSLFVAFIIFGISLLKVLQYKLDVLSKADQSEMLAGLKECIVFHKQIVSFRDDLLELVSLVCLLDVLCCGIMMCVMMYFMSVVQDMALSLAAGTLLVVPFYVFTITYWFANEFAFESLKISDSVYNLPWFYGNKELRKCVQIMLARCQRPLMLTAGGIYPMTMEHYQGILRVCYSYFSLLKGVSQAD